MMQPADYIALVGLIVTVLMAAAALVAGWAVMGSRLRALELHNQSNNVPALATRVAILDEQSKTALQRLDEQGRALEAVIRLEAEFRSFRETVTPAFALLQRAMRTA